MDQRRAPSERYIYQGPLYSAAAAADPIANAGWFADVRAGFVPDFLCPQNKFVRYGKSCPMDVTVMAYYSTGYLQHMLAWTPEQLEAACGESKAQGLRSVVHAHSAEAVQRAARAGCSRRAGGRSWRGRS